MKRVLGEGAPDPPSYSQATDGMSRPIYYVHPIYNLQQIIRCAMMTRESSQSTFQKTILNIKTSTDLSSIL